MGAAIAVELGNARPIHFRQHLGNMLVLGFRRQAENPRYGLIEIDYASGFIRHEHAVFDGIEQRFEKAPLPRQPLHDGLEPFGVQSPNATEHFIKKTGFGSGHQWFQLYR